MINKKKKYIGRLTLAVAITSILFSGCGVAQKELAQTDRAFLRENIIPDSYGTERFTHTADYHQSERAGLYQVSYGATNTELTLEKVNVAVGDHEKGDILVAFKPGRYRKRLRTTAGRSVRISFWQSTTGLL